MCQHRAAWTALWLALLGFGWQFSSSAVGAEPGGWAQEQLDSLVELYRFLHQHPELSYEEKETSARMAEELRATGAEVTTGVGGYGVVALVRNGQGPTVMLRTDMDALPITEQTNLVYASQVRARTADDAEVGVMHACGHDVHMTNLIGVARYLAAHREHWQGTLMLVAQPAEERGGGAAAMLADGLFTRFPKPDYAIALHVDATIPTGSVGCRAGYAMANVDSVDITIHGKGGHGAHPDTTIDPIVQAAQLVMSLQTIVSREIKPTEPAVITVGSIHGGTKHNIIGDRCHLQLTVRSYSDETRRRLLEGIRRKAEAVATGAGAPEPTIETSEGTPALRNDGPLTEHLISVFRGLLGEDRVILTEPAMVGEDFGRYGLAGVPILMFRLGAVDGRRLERYEQLGQTPPSLHSSQFYPDVEETLTTGVNVTASAVLELMKPAAEGDESGER